MCDEKKLEDNEQRRDMILSTLLKDHLAVMGRRQKGGKNGTMVLKLEFVYGERMT